MEHYFFVTLAKLGCESRALAYVCKQPPSWQRQAVCFMSRHKGTAGWSDVIQGRSKHAVWPQC